jgi:hypothetical protein
MKKFPLYLSMLLLLALAFSNDLTAQTYKQRVRSAELLSQILPPELKITADNVRRASQKDIRSTIAAAGYSSNYTAALEDMLAPTKAIDWRGLIVELTSDCDERAYMIFTSVDGETIIHVMFRRGKKCEKLYLILVEMGLVYPLDASFPVDEYDVCLSKKCIISQPGSCCWDIIVGMPKGTECPPPSCELGSCNCQIVRDKNFIVDFYMEG